MKEYDVAIVGAGPSGLMVAYGLAERFGKEISIGIFDKGRGIKERHCGYHEGKSNKCKGCSTCDITDGVMGAGMKSDGKVHFHKDVMELYRMGIVGTKEVESDLRYIEGCFERWGLEGAVYPLNSDNARDLSYKVSELKLGDDFELKTKERTRHIGSDCLPNLVSNMMNDIFSKGRVDLHTKSELNGYTFNGGSSKLEFNEKGEQRNYVANKVLIGFGRKGSPYVQKMIEEIGIPYSYRPVEIGGRVEVPAEVMKNITNVVYNPCFRQKRDGLATFTFCANPNGFLTAEPLVSDVIGVNGEGRNDQKSNFTNFAVLTEVPVLNGNNPNDILVDLLRSNFKSSVPCVQTTRDFVGRTTFDMNNYPTGTLGGKVYENIANIFPKSISKQLDNFFLKLDRVCPGIISKDSLFIAPEAKIRGMRVLPSNKSLESGISGLHLIGDSSGLSGNIVAAALTGLMVAKNIKL